MCSRTASGRSAYSTKVSVSSASPSSERTTLEFFDRPQNMGHQKEIRNVDSVTVTGLKHWEN